MYPKGAVLRRYFPPEDHLAVRFDNGEVRDVFPRSWIAGKLLDFHEPPLFERRAEPSLHAYRASCRR